MMDNLSKILPLLEFKSEDDFYYLQILQRKKENPELGSNSRVIKNYYITSNEYLIERYAEIKLLCKTFNARAMIRLNKRSFEKVGFKAMTNIANTMMNRDYKSLKASYDRACGLGHNDPIKKWILDIDGSYDEEYLNRLADFIGECEPKRDRDIIAAIPSKNGMHLICLPFNLENFTKFYPEIEVHKDNPTNLYVM